jgi:hypothetical protein
MKPMKETMENYSSHLTDFLVDTGIMCDKLMGINQLNSNLIRYIYEIYGGKIKIPKEIYETHLARTRGRFRLDMSLDQMEDGDHYITIKIEDVKDEEDENSNDGE